MQNLSKKKIFFLLLIIITIFIVIFYFSHKTNNYLKVVFLDIGQGDSIYIEAPNGRQMLIDGGRSSRILTKLGEVMPFGDNTIDVVIGTHPDADHIGGLNYVLDKYKVDSVIESGGVSKSKTYISLEDKITKQGMAHLLGRAGMTIVLDKEKNIYFSILYPDIKDVSNMSTNDGSIVGKLVYGNTSVFLTADSPIEKELYLVHKNPQILKSNVLKLGHHGSRTSSSSEYLKAISPDVAIISAGKNNSYGHPHKEVLDKLSFLKIPYLSTYDSGNITCTSDALVFSCN